MLVLLFIWYESLINGTRVNFVWKNVLDDIIVFVSELLV